MNNLIDYITNYGSKTYQEYPFNEIDACIYSLLPYFDFSHILLPTTIKEAFKQSNNICDYKTKDKFTKKNNQLLKLLTTSPRYQDNIITDFQKIINNETQFGAIAIKVSHKFKYIAFEGTNNYLIGWKENFGMCLEQPLKAEILASKFLQKNIKLSDILVYCGGHSKGGHLAIRAAMNLKLWQRLTIRYIFNYDGPGFLKEVIDSKKYQRIANKIHSYFPQDSIVGMIMNNQGHKKYIKSSKKGIQEHSVHTWEINDNKFITSNLSNDAKSFHHKIELLTNYPLKKRELFINTIFNLLNESGYTYVSELKKINFAKMSHIIKGTMNFNKEEKDLILSVIKVLISTSNEENEQNTC